MTIGIPGSIQHSPTAAENCFVPILNPKLANFPASKKPLLPGLLELMPQLLVVMYSN